MPGTTCGKALDRKPRVANVTCMDDVQVLFEAIEKFRTCRDALGTVSERRLAASSNGRTSHMPYDRRHLPFSSETEVMEKLTFLRVRG